MATPSAASASSPGRRGSTSSMNNSWLNIVTPPPSNNHHNNPSNSSNKSYGNKHVDAELEALKQRGLAKLLNKHFTETALLLEQEKAAADAALRDLEERKARTSDFNELNYRNGEISPLDEMCLQANKWRAECRRKERETMLLYQRYVHRFGDTLHSLGPHNANTTNTTPDRSPAMAAPPPSKAPVLLHKRNTDSATVVGTTNSGTKPAITMSTQLVPNMAKQIEATLEEYLKQGAVSMPSLQTLGKDETYHNLHQKEEEQFRNFYRRQLEQKGIDVKYPGFSLTNRPDFPGFPIHTVVEEHHRTNGNSTNNNNNNNGTNNDDDDDEDSVMSELTTLQSVIIQDCERSVVTYLQEEHQKIQSLVGQPGDYDEDDDAESAISQAESMVQQMEEILAEYQNTRAMSSIHTSAKMAKHHAPLEYKTDNPNECWMVYYDEFYQQDYYHEKFTNRTQWEPPNGNNNNNNNDGTSCSSANTLTIAEVMPDMRVYRQRRRAKRRSRRTWLLIGMTLLFAIVAMVWQYDTSRIHTKMVLHTLLPEKLVNYYYWAQSEPTTLVNETTTTSTSRGIPKPTRAVPTAYEKKVVTHTTTATEIVSSRELVVGTAVVVAAVKRNDCDDDNNDSSEFVVDNLRRPWLCNLPLAWLFHSRCWMLARRNPLFDVQELLMILIQ